MKQQLVVEQNYFVQKQIDPLILTMVIQQVFVDQIVQSHPYHLIPKNLHRIVDRIVRENQHLENHQNHSYCVVVHQNLARTCYCCRIVQ